MLREGGGPSVSANRTGVAIGLPGHGQGPRGPGLPHGHPGGGDAQMILRVVCDELGPGREPPAVPRGVQGPHGPHWRPGGPGGGEGQLALQHEAVVGRRSPRLSGPSIYRKLGYTNDMIKLMGLDPSAPPHHGNVHGVRTTGRRTIRWR